MDLFRKMFGKTSEESTEKETPIPITQPSAETPALDGSKPLVQILRVSIQRHNL